MPCLLDDGDGNGEGDREVLHGISSAGTHMRVPLGGKQYDVLAAAKHAWDSGAVIKESYASDAMHSPR